MTRCTLPSVLLALVLSGGLAACGEKEKKNTVAPKVDPSTGDIAVFPMPGTTTASPASEISLRGARMRKLGKIEVTGSESGPVKGKLMPHADRNGASFVPDEEFEEGETVTVATKLDVHRGKDGAFSFQTVERPLEGLGSDRDPTDPALEARREQAGDLPEGAAIRFRSRPDLRPPDIELQQQAKPGTGKGLMFMSPKKVFGAKQRPGVQSGPAIVDNQGRFVWFANRSEGNVTDLRVQQVRGKRFLTFWAGRQILGTGEGEISLYDDRYEKVGAVQGGNGYQLDFHDTTLTERGTALVSIYNPLDRDLSEVGGPKDGRILEPVVQEIEIATGRVLFEWHGSEFLDLDDSREDLPKDRGDVWDFFHNNSIVEDDDGNLIISGREFWQAIKLDRRTGEVLWRLGGDDSDFELGEEATFSFQHDVERDPDGTLRIFDNASSPKQRPQSRVLWLDVDEQKKTATFVRQIEHPDKLSAGTQGNAERLPNGNVFVGWGSQGYFSEFTQAGDMLFDARIERGNDTYRAYRFPWTGRPDDTPAAVVEDGKAYVSWNGSTETVRWEVLGGASKDGLAPIGKAKWEGFETAIALKGRPKVLRVRALDAQGRELAVSDPVTVKR